MARGRPIKYQTIEDRKKARAETNRRHYVKRRANSKGTTASQHLTGQDSAVDGVKEETTDLFMPSIDDYPQHHVVFQDRNGMQVTHEGISVGVWPTSNGIISPIWNNLQSVGREIDGWRFVADHEDLAEIVWEVWRHRRCAGTILFLRAEIERGEQFIQRMVNIIKPGTNFDVDLPQLLGEMVDLLSRVHRAIAGLQSKLDMIEGGLAKRHPDILCPDHLKG